MKIFVSHSSRDIQTVKVFQEFLSSLSVDVEVFCSTINQGEDFVKSIENGLKSSDIFIPLISRNYLDSNYCMVELGYAYSRIINRRKKYYIFPFCIAPLSKSEALLGTPLSRLQTSALNSVEELYDFIQILRTEGLLKEIHLQNNKIGKFVDNINLSIMDASNILSSAIEEPICSDSNNHYAVEVSRENNSQYIVNFNLFANGLMNKPDFISLVLKFPGLFNFYNYLCTKKDICFYCSIDNYTESIKEISIEFKFHESHQKLKEYRNILIAGKNDIKIPLSDMNIDGLKQISEICFVVWQNAFVDNEGMFKVQDIYVR